MHRKLHSPIPYFLLTALLGLVPVLNNKYPTRFFPALSPDLVSVLCVVLGVAAAYLGFSRGWDRLQHQARARKLLRQAAEQRDGQASADENDVSAAGRFISRLVRNADEDLSEIKPDFSEHSLRRLDRYLPALLGEIENEEDARIRLGIVGVYLGETACRNYHWQWHFKADPALGRFGYLVSALRREGKETDPFFLAAEWMLGNLNLKELLEPVR